LHADPALHAETFLDQLKPEFGLTRNHTASTVDHHGHAAPLRKTVPLADMQQGFGALAGERVLPRAVGSKHRPHARQRLAERMLYLLADGDRLAP